ncbi:MAG: AzlC family ABC transporter permease, partial [Eubacteriaceae bacterium]|nr:AzlC family ABC transporter permease [Eubacteriaceae bacterium]
AVSFSLGIAARRAGLNAAEGFLASLFTIASAGEYAGFRVIASCGTYLEMAAVILVANCRYLLMSCALAQRADEGMKMIHRVGVGFFITDELFALNIARPAPLDPLYAYGAASTSVLPWAIGTSLGITAGNMLSVSLVSALSVALYGMFLAIIIPPARKNRVILGSVAVSFLLSWASSVMPVLRDVSEGTRIILLTVVIASAAAVMFPVDEEGIS